MEMRAEELFFPLNPSLQYSNLREAPKLTFLWPFQSIPVNPHDL